MNGTNTAWWGRPAVERISLQTVFFTPTVALKLHRRISVGAGLAISKAAVWLKQGITLSASAEDDLTLDLSGGDVGIGATAGLLIQVIPELLSAGLTFRSGLSYTFEGRAAFTKHGIGAEVPAGLRAWLIDGPATVSIALPHVLSLGFAGFPIKPLTVAFSFDVTTWSSYDQLQVSFRGSPELELSTPKHWTNTVTIPRRPPGLTTALTFVPFESS